MPKGVRRHVGPVGVPRPSLGPALLLIPAPLLSELARASAGWRPRGPHPAGVGGRRPLPWAEALRRRAGRELVTALRTQFGADQYGRFFGKLANAIFFSVPRRAKSRARVPLSRTLL